MILVHLYYNLLFAFSCLCITGHIPPPTPFSTINNMSTSVNNSNFTSVFFKQACHANAGADRK